MKRNNHIRLLVLWLVMTMILSLGGCQNPSAPAASTAASTHSQPSEGFGQSPEASGAGQKHVTSSSNLRVHYLDVGQGDSILVESEGHFMLIDAGENDQGQTVVSYLKNAGLHSLDYVIGTHPHSDHIGGLDDVLREFPVEKVILPPVEHTTKTFEDVLDAIQEKGLKITMPKAGDTYPLGNASFTILAPAGDYGDNLNNWSVGVRLSYKDNHFVMCGDAEKEAESDIVTYNKELSADVLKAGHHGSSTSTSNGFLEAVSPSYVVIQCGKDNSYGHPHKETLEKLEERGIKTLRTDLEGTVIADCDGSSITWSSGNEGETGKASHTPTLPSESGSPDINQTSAYVLNTSTKKFHLPSCQSVSSMKEGNRQDVTDNREALIAMGYVPCKQCNP